jgi:hypothetical protein
MEGFLRVLEVRGVYGVDYENRVYYTYEVLFDIDLDR